MNKHPNHSVRLTNTDRRAIFKLAMEKPKADAETTKAAIVRQVAEAIAHHANGEYLKEVSVQGYGGDLERIQNAGNLWVYLSAPAYTVHVNVTDTSEYYRFHPENPVRVFGNTLVESRCEGLVVKVSKDNPLVEKCRQADTDIHATRDTVNLVSNKVKRILDDARTVGSLLATWPECEPWVNQVLGAPKLDCATTDKLPELGELNRALGLVK